MVTTTFWESVQLEYLPLEVLFAFLIGAAFHLLPRLVSRTHGNLSKNSRVKYKSVWEDSELLAERTDGSIGSTDGSDMDRNRSALSRTARKDRYPPRNAAAKNPAWVAHPSARHSDVRSRAANDFFSSLSGDMQRVNDSVGLPMDDSASSLLDILSTLTPADAAVVRDYLKSKEEEGSSRPMQRPFTPFGSRTRPEGQRQKKIRDPDDPFGAKFGSQSDGTDTNAADSLRKHLYDLAQVDSGRVLTVRKITRLGMDSPAPLKAYFSGFGTVERVMVSHANTKTPEGHVRVRPATVAFVLMSKVEEAEAIKACCEHIVQGVTVSVHDFQSHPADST